MAEPFAVNASPLIFLAQAGLLDLLRVVGDSGVVPQAVLCELQAGVHIRDDTARVVREAD